MDLRYKYKKGILTNDVANKTGLPCGEINNEWVSCHSTDFSIKCCSDAKAGYFD